MITRLEIRQRLLVAHARLSDGRLVDAVDALASIVSRAVAGRSAPVVATIVEPAPAVPVVDDAPYVSPPAGMRRYAAPIVATIVDDAPVVVLATPATEPDLITATYCFYA